MPTTLHRLGLVALIAAVVLPGCSGSPSPTAPTPAPTAANCPITVSSAAVTVSASGGATVLTVTTPATCAWTVTTNATFLTVTSGTAQTGSGSVTFTAAPNTGTGERSGTITIGGVPVAVTQAAAAPALRFAPGAPPDAVADATYAFDFAVATGGVAPIRYQLETLGGFPPIGLILAPNGMLTGTAEPGSAVNPFAVSFRVCAVDGVGTSVCANVTVTVVPDAILGNWAGTIVLREGCVTPLPFNYPWTGAIRRTSTGGRELMINIPLLTIANQVLAVGLVGNAISFRVEYGPFVYNYRGTLSADRRSVANGTFDGPDCNPTNLTQLQSGTWSGAHQ